jgi:light-regulated signal transduction histidine kinase (bacteriophytochrome)
MIGKNDFDYCRLKGIDNTLAKIRRAKFNKAKKSKKTVEWIDQIIKNNKNIHIYRKLYPVYDNDEFTYMIGYGIDVTTLKETQYQLEIQNKILTNKNQELERFTYIASHDLQEPLLSLISFSKILEEEYSEKLDEEGRMFVQFINNSATRMRSLISGLMEYNRINLKEILDPYDFNILLQEVQDDLNNSISNHKAIISIQKLPTLRCYPTFIRILFQNLISNAIKFTTKEVIPQIEISSLEREKDWLFKVSDNGIGIPVKNLQEIFMVFKRLHKEQNYAGLGIGLAHCKKIVEIHNGEIWVDSVEGTGSIFYFTIAKKI